MDAEAYYDGAHDPFYEVENGDYLVGMDGNFNLRKWRGKIGLLNQRVMRIRKWREGILGDYVALPLQMVLNHLHEGTSQTTVKHLSAKQVNAIAVPIPRFEDQQRIVTKVNELMALCDELEEAQIKRESRRDRLVAATLHGLNNGDKASENEKTLPFAESAHLYFNHLPKLTTRPEHIKQLRQTILNLAVRGKLVPQVPTDESVKVLLRRIQKRRSQLCDEGAIPKPKPLSPLSEQSLPYDVSPGWEWTMLGDLCYKVSDGPHHSPRYVGAKDGIPFLSTRNVKVDHFDLSNVKYVSKEDHELYSKRTRPEWGDIIYTKGGTTGIARVNDLDFEFSVWVHLAVLKIAREFLCPYYIAMALNSPFGYEQAQRYTQGTSNSDLGLTRMIKILLPLPPLAEQRRIVAKVDELMTRCDELEAQLKVASTGSASLLDAAIHEALDRNG